MTSAGRRMRIGGGIIQRESVESVKSVIWHLTPLPPRARVFIVHDDGGMKGMRLGALENHGLHGLRGPEQLRTVGECPAVSGSVWQKVLFKGF